MDWSPRTIYDRAHCKLSPHLAHLIWPQCDVIRRLIFVYIVEEVACEHAQNAPFLIFCISVFHDYQGLLITFKGLRIVMFDCSCRGSILYLLITEMSMCQNEFPNVFGTVLGSLFIYFISNIDDGLIWLQLLAEAASCISWSQRWVWSTWCTRPLWHSSWESSTSPWPAPRSRPSPPSESWTSSSTWRSRLTSTRPEGSTRRTSSSSPSYSPSR